MEMIKDIITLFKVCKIKIKAVIFVLFVAFLLALLSIVSPFFIGQIIDLYVVGFDLDRLILLSSALLASYVLSAVLSYLLSYLSQKLSVKIAFLVRENIYVKLDKLPISFFDKTPVGRLNNTIIMDTENLAEGLNQAITQFFGGIFSIVLTLIIMFFIKWEIAVVVTALTPLSVLIVQKLSVSIKSTFKENANQVADMNSHLKEYFSALKVIKDNEIANKLNNDFECFNEELYKTAFKSHFSAALVNPLSRMVNNFVYIAAGVLGIFLGVSPGMLSSFLLYSNQFAKPINEISSVTSVLMTAIASLRRILTLLEVPNESDETTLATVASNYVLGFENVNFSYDGKKKVIDNFTFIAKQNEKIAIVGKTGSGKTTLINLALRFYETDSGCITINNQRVNQINKDSLRSLFTIVFQDSFIINASVLDNLLIANPSATREMAEEALKRFDCYEFVSNLKNGMDTVINKGSLSVGQNQLLAIARASLAPAKMLILDEATSSLDSETEELVVSAMEKLSIGKTTIVIAHRLKTIEKCDRIIVLDKGKIAEVGSHQELILRDGIYSDMFKSYYQTA